MLNAANIFVTQGKRRLFLENLCVCPCSLLAQSFQCGFDIFGVLQVFFLETFSRK